MTRSSSRSCTTPASRAPSPSPERVAFVEHAVAEAGLTDRVRVEAFADRLLVDVCRDLGADVVVKGLRGGTDFAYELPMALMNRHLTGVETVFLPGDPALEHVSSSLVKEVVRYGGDVDGPGPRRGPRRPRRPAACTLRRPPHAP